ncbi:MAG TPA: tetraacyldisaccharide 4'-kinase [Rickettsiales bacterium]|nr:tetraacyldisaccharide 4'-kinase [Rickettsiales bacterium]
MRAPIFWKDKTLLSGLLLPVAAIYSCAVQARLARTPPKTLDARVICVGNLVAGGAGKTPVALAIGRIFKELGKNAHYLSRGYKGTHSGVTRVDPAKHSALEVGDEPLLLAEVLPTWVAKDRASGAAAAVAAGAEIIIMDDGFQNPSLHKDVSLLVIDGHYGLGNERVIPAGPLRENIEQAMGRVSAVIMIGEDKHNVLKYVLPGTPVLHAKVQPTAAANTLKDKAVVAFCGLAAPRKFYRTLQEIGCSIRKYVAYPDHYVFKSEDLRFLREKAAEQEATLVTTQKDYVRLPAEMRTEVATVPIEVVFGDREALLKVLLA